MGPGADLIPIDFETLFAASPNPYVVLDRSLTIGWMNDAYLRVTMRDRNEVIGRRMFDAFPSDPDSESHRLLKASFERVLEDGKPDEIALIRYDIRGPNGTMEARYWSATHTPLRGDDGRAAYILQHTVDVTELHGLRRLRDEMGLVRRASAVQARNRDLSEESERFRSLVEQAPGFIAVLSRPSYRFELANRAYRRLVGNREVIGRTVAEALPEVIGQGFVELLDKVCRRGEPYVGRQERVLLRREDAERPEHRYLDFIYQPIFADGQVRGVFVQGHDVTEQVEAAEAQKLLINELNHRVKNTLAIVQGLAGQSFRKLDNSAEAQRTFDARLSALAAAHSLLTEQNWEAARLVDTIANALEATAGSDVARFELEGPDFSLQPQVAVALAMIVHELSTNAIKHGALSQDGGRVRVVWTLVEEGEDCLLTLDWLETGGPPVSEPERRGFGTRLIQRGLAGEKDNRVTMKFRPEGLRCRFEARLPQGGK